MMICPRCRFEQPDGSMECQRCGIIFKKYQLRQNQSSEDSAAAILSDQPPMADRKEKQSFIDSFRINDLESCEKAIRNGGIAAMISAGITAIFAVAGFFTSSSNKDLAYLLDPWMTVDVVLIIVLGVFVFRKSRVASTLLVLYFAVSKAIMWYDMGKAQGLLLSIIFFLYYFTAMRGTYIWYASYRDAPATTVP